MDLKVSKTKKLLRLLILFLIFYLILFFAFVIKSFQTGRKLTTNDFVGKTYVDEQSTYYIYFSDENRLFFKELKNDETMQYYNYSFIDGIIRFNAKLSNDENQHEYNYVFLSENHLYSVDFNKLLILNK